MLQQHQLTRNGRRERHANYGVSCEDDSKHVLLLGGRDSGHGYAWIAPQHFIEPQCLHRFMSIKLAYHVSVRSWRESGRKSGTDTI
jgi:hypothetical protein